MKKNVPWRKKEKISRTYIYNDDKRKRKYFSYIETFLLEISINLPWLNTKETYNEMIFLLEIQNLYIFLYCPFEWNKSLMIAGNFSSQEKFQEKYHNFMDVIGKAENFSTVERIPSPEEKVFSLYHSNKLKICWFYDCYERGKIFCYFKNQQNMKLHSQHQ